MTDNSWLIVAVVVIVILVAIVIFLAVRQQNTRRLKSRFGSEYERTLDELGGRRSGEAELQQREKRVKHFELKPLSPQERDRFTKAWRQIQGTFVDEPGAAVSHADQLIGEVMTARGYPSGDFEQRSADVSVDHAEVLQSWRNAHQIALRHQKGEAGTEDLRQAMVSYRALFTDLVGAAPAEAGQKAEELTK